MFEKETLVIKIDTRGIDNTLDGYKQWETRPEHKINREGGDRNKICFED